MEHKNKHCEQNVEHFNVSAIGTVRVLTLCYLELNEIFLESFDPHLVE